MVVWNFLPALWVWYNFSTCRFPEFCDGFGFLARLGFFGVVLSFGVSWGTKHVAFDGLGHQVKQIKLTTDRHCSPV